MVLSLNYSNPKKPANALRHQRIAACRQFPFECADKQTAPEGAPHVAIKVSFVYLPASLADELSVAAGFGAAFATPTSAGRSTRSPIM